MLEIVRGNRIDYYEAYKINFMNAMGSIEKQLHF
jgi:hypothetical protein